MINKKKLFDVNSFSLNNVEKSYFSLQNFTIKIKNTNFLHIVIYLNLFSR